MTQPHRDGARRGVRCMGSMHAPPSTSLAGGVGERAESCGALHSCIALLCNAARRVLAACMHARPTLSRLLRQCEMRGHPENCSGLERSCAGLSVPGGLCPPVHPRDVCQMRTVV